MKVMRWEAWFASAGVVNGWKPVEPVKVERIDVDAVTVDVMKIEET